MSSAYLVLLLAAYCVASQPGNMTQLREHIFQNYDWSVRPNFGGPAVEIGITGYILEIHDIEDEDQTVTLTLYFRQTWKDPRLEFSSTQWKVDAITGTNFDIWKPDTFFPNERDAKFHDTTLYNSFVRIKHDGTVLYSVRYTLELSCPMDFTNFPMDVQICKLELESYGYKASEIKYHWSKGDNSVNSNQNGAYQDEFKFMGSKLSEKQIMLSSGNYSRSEVMFKFARKPGYYIFHLYLPALLVTALAYLTLWLSARASLARLSLGITSLIVMSSILVGGRFVTPTVSFLTPLDIYLGLSFIYVLVVLIYHAFLTSTLQEEVVKTLEESMNLSSPLCQKVARIGFGITLLVFNFLYWVIFTQTV